MNFHMSINPERSGFRFERANLRPYRAYFRPERAEYKPGRVDLGPKRADFAPKCTDFMPKKVDFGTERVDLGLLGLISSLKEPDLGLGRDIWIERQTYRRIKGNLPISCVEFGDLAYKDRFN